MPAAIFFPRQPAEESPELAEFREKVRAAQAELDRLQAPRRVTFGDVVRYLFR